LQLSPFNPHCWKLSHIRVRVKGAQRPYGQTLDTHADVKDTP